MEDNLNPEKHAADWYEIEYGKIDKTILDLKLAKPALRALINISIYTLADLKKIPLQQLEKLHGMGPGSIKKMKQLLV